MKNVYQRAGRSKLGSAIEDASFKDSKHPATISVICIHRTRTNFLCHVVHIKMRKVESFHRRLSFVREEERRMFTCINSLIMSARLNNSSLRILFPGNAIQKLGDDATYIVHIRVLRPIMLIKHRTTSASAN